MVHFIVKDWFAGALLNHVGLENILTVIIKFQSILNKDVLKSFRNLSTFNLNCEIKWISDHMLRFNILFVLIEFSRKVDCTCFVSRN
jgi:hypothetical protein